MAAAFTVAEPDKGDLLDRVLLKIGFLLSEPEEARLSWARVCLLFSGGSEESPRIDTVGVRLESAPRPG